MVLRTGSALCATSGVRLMRLGSGRAPPGLSCWTWSEQVCRAWNYQERGREIILREVGFPAQDDHYIF